MSSIFSSYRDGANSAVARTGYAVLWADTIPADFSSWKTIGSATVDDASATLQLSDRDGGVWLLWPTNLPSREGMFFTEISEAIFRP
jgi:hypothetical protein